MFARCLLVNENEGNDLAWNESFIIFRWFKSAAKTSTRTERSKTVLKRHEP